MAPQRWWQAAARWLPHDTNDVRENKGLRSLKRVGCRGTGAGLHRAALTLGWPCPSPEALTLTVGNNQWQQRKQQNLHNR